MFTPHLLSVFLNNSSLGKHRGAVWGLHPGGCVLLGKMRWMDSDWICYSLGTRVTWYFTVNQSAAVHLSLTFSRRRKDETTICRVYRTRILSTGSIWNPQEATECYWEMFQTYFFSVHHIWHNYFACFLWTAVLMHLHNKSDDGLINKTDGGNEVRGGVGGTWVCRGMRAICDGWNNFLYITVLFVL